MSFFHLFGRPKIDGPRQDALHTANLQHKAVNTTDHRHKAAKLEKLVPVGIEVSSRSRTPARAKQAASVVPKVSQNATYAKDYDASHPPPFKEIFHLSVRVAPAHTCLFGKANAAASSKPSSSSTLTAEKNVDQVIDKRASRIAPSHGTPELLRKIFALTKNGYILQFADRGASDRMPERVQKLTLDTVAIASDLVPGRPYTVLVAESTNLGDLGRPDHSSFRSKLGIKHGTQKRAIPNTVIVLDTSTQLEEWLFSIRKEIQRLDKSGGSQTQSPLHKHTSTQNEYEGAGRDQNRDQMPTTPRESVHDSSVDNRTDSPRTEVIQPSEKTPIRTSLPSGNKAFAQLHKPLPELNDVSMSRDKQYGSIFKSYAEKGQAPNVTSPTFTTSPKSTRSSASQIHRSTGLRQSNMTALPHDSSHTARQTLSLKEEPGSPTRKDSLANDNGRNYFQEQGASQAARIRKRASHHGPVAHVERPALRTVNSMGRLRAPQNTLQEADPMPALIPSRYYGDTDLSQSVVNDQDATRLENDEYHAFHQELSMDPPDGTDEYHAFQHSLSVNPNENRRPLTGKKHRISVLPSPSAKQASSGEALSSPTKFQHDMITSSHESARPHSSKSTAPSFGRFPFKLRGAVPSAPDNIVVEAQREDSHEHLDPNTRRRLHRPTTMEVRTTSVPPQIHSANPNRPALHMSRSEHGLKDRARIPAPLHLSAIPSHQDMDDADDDDEEEGEMLFFQTNNVDAAPRKGSVPSWTQVPPSPGRLPSSELALPAIAFSPPVPPPVAPLPRPPTMASTGRF